MLSRVDNALHTLFTLHGIFKRPSDNIKILTPTLMTLITYLHGRLLHESIYNHSLINQ